MRRVGGLEHLYGFKGFRSRAVQDRVDGVVIHGLEAGGEGNRGGILSAYIEAFYVVDGDGGDSAFEGAGKLRAEGDGAEG